MDEDFDSEALWMLLIISLFFITVIGAFTSFSTGFFWVIGINLVFFSLNYIFTWDERKKKELKNEIVKTKKEIFLSEHEIRYEGSIDSGKICVYKNGIYIGKLMSYREKNAELMIDHCRIIDLGFNFDNEAKELLNKQKTREINEYYRLKEEKSLQEIESLTEELRKLKEKPLNPKIQKEFEQTFKKSQWYLTKAKEIDSIRKDILIGPPNNL